MARALGISRLTVKKYLQAAVPVRRETRPRARPVWDAVRARVEGLLAESVRWTGGKQQLTATLQYYFLLPDLHPFPT